MHRCSVSTSGNFCKPPMNKTTTKNDGIKSPNSTAKSTRHINTIEDTFVVQYVARKRESKRAL